MKIISEIRETVARAKTVTTGVARELGHRTIHTHQRVHDGWCAIMYGPSLRWSSAINSIAGIPTFNQEAWDRNLELYMEASNDVHQAAHELVNGQTTTKEFGNFLAERYMRYIGEGTEAMFEAMTQAATGKAQ